MERFRIGLLGARPEGFHARDLRRAAEGLGMEVALLDHARLAASLGEAGGSRAERPAVSGVAGLDAVLVRSVPSASLEHVVFRMDVLGRLAATGLPVVNPPRAIECAIDKYLALARIEAARLPVPRTRVAQTAADGLRDFEALGGDTVLKPLFGSAGRGILRLSDRELAGRSFRALERFGAVIYQQEFVEHLEGDLRVLVLGEEAALAMRRRPRGGGPDDWRSNVSRGGRAEAHPASSKEADLAVRAARAAGCLVSGVDLLPAADGRLLVSEVNSAPGWRALARVTGADVAALVLRQVLRAAGR